MYKNHGLLSLKIEKTIEKGDTIKIKNGDEYVMVKIKKINKYESFEEYLSQEGLKRTLPGIITIKDGNDIYHKFYTPEQEIEFGILAIKIKRL
jgi:ASC-1-like (ASCH) protein